MVADILARILDSKRQEVARARQVVPFETLRRQAEALPPPRDFWNALQTREGRGTRIVAEIKKASPSAGIIRADFDPLAIAATYAHHGAAAISVLTDKPFFQGDLTVLQAVRQHVALPLLRKDFVLDAYQLYEARLHGADAVLLIAAALEVPVLTDLAALSRELGLEPFVEVHTAAELEKALSSDCRLVGINNRDLHTFHTNVATTLELLPRVPSSHRVVSESGIRDRATVERLEARGVAAFLVGESLMRGPDTGAKLDQLRGVGPASWRACHDPR